MKKLIQKIQSEGLVINNKMLKVDHFINHQIDTKLLDDIAKEFASYFKQKKITKIVTIEASGIAFAVATARYLDFVPVVFARKAKSEITDKNIYTSDVISFTKKITYTIYVEKNYLNKGENILIIDDFLANGHAALGLVDLVKQSGASVAGLGFVIEKSFQAGKKILIDEGYDVFSLAKIINFEDGKAIIE